MSCSVPILAFPFTLDCSDYSFSITLNPQPLTKYPVSVVSHSLLSSFCLSCLSFSQSFFNDIPSSKIRGSNPRPSACKADVLTTVLYVVYMTMQLQFFPHRCLWTKTKMNEIDKKKSNETTWGGTTLENCVPPPPPPRGVSSQTPVSHLEKKPVSPSPRGVGWDHH